jgi:hypothetical protein
MCGFILFQQLPSKILCHLTDTLHVSPLREPLYRLSNTVKQHPLVFNAEVGEKSREDKSNVD